MYDYNFISAAAINSPRNGGLGLPGLDLNSG
jgi:hypothetical protein